MADSGKKKGLALALILTRAFTFGGIDDGDHAQDGQDDAVKTGYEFVFTAEKRKNNKFPLKLDGKTKYEADDMLANIAYEIRYAYGLPSTEKALLHVKYVYDRIALYVQHTRSSKLNISLEISSALRKAEKIITKGLHKQELKRLNTLDKSLKKQKQVNKQAVRMNGRELSKVDRSHAASVQDFNRSLRG